MATWDLTEEEIQRLLDDGQRTIDEAQRTIERLNRSLGDPDQLLMAIAAFETAMILVRVSGKGDLWQVAAVPADPFSLGVLGLSLAAEALVMVAFALTSWFVTRRARRRMVDPALGFKWLTGMTEEVAALLRDFQSKQDPATRAEECLQLAHQWKGTYRVYLGLAASGLAIFLLENVGGPWALLNLAAVQAVILVAAFPSKSAKKRWIRRRVAEFVDAALPTDFME